MFAPGIREWTRTDGFWQRAWIDQSDPIWPIWYSQAGPGVACTIDPTKCTSVHAKFGPYLEIATPSDLKEITFRSITDNPREFLENRLTYILGGWFAAEIDTDRVEVRRDHALAQGIVFLISIFALLYFSVYKAIKTKGADLLLLIPAMLLTLSLPFAIMHIEVRYLLPIKIFGLLSFTTASLIISLQNKLVLEKQLLKQE
jgi:hypothetical protein